MRAWTVCAAMAGGAAIAAMACASVPRATVSLAWPHALDTLRTESLRDGVTHGYLYVPSGPWAIHVMRVELDKCNAAMAVKGGDGAIARTRTSVLLNELATTQRIIGGVNADFFSLGAPLGVPENALVSNGRVISGPSVQPVLAFDVKGRPHISPLTVVGAVTIGTTRYAIDAWNRRATTGIALYDANWSRMTDTASNVIEVSISGVGRAHVTSVETTARGAQLHSDAIVLVAGADAPDSVRTALLALRPGDMIQTAIALAPFQPREAVGGRPVLVQDSLIPSIVDTEGQPGFATGRHPRTAVGIARDGKRLILVVVDGRQMPYSDGMSLRELATLMLALGARDAINLDGGGSTTFVYEPPDSLGTLRIGNRPSDAAGERAVGNALAIVRKCR